MWPKVRLLPLLSLVALAEGYTAPLAASKSELIVPVGAWRVVQRESGPVNYYTIHRESPLSFIRGEYRPPLKTVVLGFPLPDDERPKIRYMRWKWRAIKLPAGGNECVESKGDSAAVIYVSWKRFMRWYCIKYVWTTASPRLAVCDKKSNPFMAQDTVVLEAGGPLNIWREESIDLDAEYRKHFAEGDPTAAVPDFMGIALMTDGDQNNTSSVGDFADFHLIRR